MDDKTIIGNDSRENYVEVRLICSAVNVRKDHFIESEAVDVISNDRTYKVRSFKNGKPYVVKGSGSSKGWLKLAPFYRKEGFISYDYCEIVE